MAWVITPVNALLLLLLVIIGFQLIPLPVGWVKYLSAQTYIDKLQLYDLMTQSKDSSMINPGWMTLAYYSHPMVVEGLKLIAYFGMFFLVVNVIHSKRRIDVLIYILILVGLFEALYGIYQIFSGTPKVWWWESRFGQQQRATGTFIGANHFAAYLELLIPLTLGFMIAQRKQVKRLISGLGSMRATLQKGLNLFSPESAEPQKVFFFFVAVLLGLALLFSGSRGGIVSLCVSIILSSIMLITRKRYRKIGYLSLLFCVAVFIYGLHIGIDPTLKRFEDIDSLANRIDITQTIFPMIVDYPFTGVGWGNFRYLYPRYIEEEDMVSTSGYAHNDWIEAGIESGLISGFLIVSIFVIFLSRFMQTWRQRRNLHALGIGTGVIAGMMAVAIHSYFDFNMRIPANPLILAALMGIGYVAIYREGRGPSESFFYRVRKIQLTPIRKTLITILTLLLFGGSIVLVMCHFRAEAYCPTEWNSTMNLNWNPDLAEIDKAIALNPWNAEYYWKKAGFLKEVKWEEVEDERQVDEGRWTQKEEIENRKENTEKGKQKKRTIPVEFFKAKNELEFQKVKHEAIIESLKDAVRLNPAQGTYWYELGLYYSLRSYDPYDFVKKWLPLAEACFDEGLKCAPKDPYMLFNVGWYWVWRASTISEEREKESGIGKFQNYFQRSLSLESHRWQTIVDRIWEYYPDDAVVLGIVPDDNKDLKSQVLQYLSKKLI